MSNWNRKNSRKKDSDFKPSAEYLSEKIKEFKKKGRQVTKLEPGTADWHQEKITSGLGYGFQGIK